MSKPYTDGPWEVDKHSPLQINAQWDGAWAIARMLEWAGDRENEPAANARLMASAPELLEACEAALDCIVMLTYGSDRIPTATVRPMLESAIAKAKGDAAP